MSVQARTDAINAFITGCKSDGIWDAIKACCILAGWNNINGALIPLKGTAPTNFNFVSGDYNRATGLIGNGTTKYLNSNRNNNADPQDSNHNAVYAASATNHVTAFIGAANPFNESGGNSVGYVTNTTAYFSRNRSSNGFPIAQSFVPGFTGISRASAGSYTFRVQGVNNTATEASEATNNRNVLVFARGTTPLSTARIAFYSIGESLDLALLDARVTTLINAYGAI